VRIPPVVRSSTSEGTHGHAGQVLIANARKPVALRDVVACEDGRIWGYRVNTDGVWSWLLRVTVEVHAGGLDAAGTTGKPTSATGLIAR
jgi:hypothetical protein